MVFALKNAYLRKEIVHIQKPECKICHVKSACLPLLSLNEKRLPASSGETNIFFIRQQLF